MNVGNMEGVHINTDNMSVPVQTPGHCLQAGKPESVSTSYI